LFIAEVLPPLGAVDTAPAEEVPSKDGLMVPDALIRVCVGFKGIKSINKLALDGAASKRIAVAIPATPNKFALILEVKFILIID
jgi:hypothetical protein